MKTEKIKFTAISIAWSYGGIMYMSIKASAGSTISIAWGDGHITNRTFYNESAIKFEHDYFPGHIIPPVNGIKFQVEISTDNPDGRIIGFFLSTADMTSVNLDVSNCTELEELAFCSYLRKEPDWSLDLSRNTALKYLNCSNCSFTGLNVSHNPALEEIDCRNNRLSHLSLSNNFLLKKLNCEWNKMEHLFIVYAPYLREAAFEEGNNIDEATKIQIQELIEDNNKSLKK